jgi:hypothetical protein
MSNSNRTRFLHVASGTCTTNVIAAAGIPGIRSIWADPLYEGPVPGGLSDEEMIDVRSDYLHPPTETTPIDPVNDLRRWRQTIEAHESYDDLVLWYEHDLFDQLNLIQLLSWVRGRLPPAKLVSLVCIGSFPGRPSFKGLGELSPRELAPLLETRRPVSDAEYRLAGRAWASFREATPEPLDALRHSDTSAMPYLAPALERFLQEYPSTADGLSRSERKLLQLAEAGPIALEDAFPRMQDNENAYYITDLSLAALAGTLSRTSPPLVTIAGGAGDGTSLAGTLRLTDAGRDVLAGRRDRVACGIDRWLGGVHLRSGRPIWRWDEERQGMVKR